MWFIAWVMAVSVFFSVSSTAQQITGSLHSTAEIINLESKLTKYEVSCTLDSTSVVDSRSLQITTLNKIKYETKILNETTIIHEVDLKNSTECKVFGVKEYLCRWNDPVSSRIKLISGEYSKTIYVGKLPPPIERSEFKCIAHERQRLTCEFPRKNFCGLSTKYKLFMLRSNLPTNCSLSDHGTYLKYDSSNETCLYSNGYKYFTFKLNQTNYIGTRETEYSISHYDIIKPAEPKDLQVSFVNNTNVEISWTLDLILRDIDRMFEHEFLLISKYGKSRSFKQIYAVTNEPIIHRIGELYAFTNYRLKVRVRIKPKESRNYEDEYWSDWSELNFKTAECRPYHAPFTVPGAYSLKQRQGDYINITVYWQKVPEYLHNGPDFEYIAFAESSFGQRLNASTTNNGTATFYNMRIDENYWVQVYTNNAKGRSPDTSVIHIFPRRENYQPKIKKVLYDNGTNYQLHWFPANDLNNLSNYTVMYCTFGGTAICEDSIEFVILPSNETKYAIRLNKTLNFALAANYPYFSTELAWQQCVVSSQSNAGQPMFNFTDRMENSIVLRLSVSCMEQSLVQSYNISYWPKNDIASKQSMSYESHVSVISLDGLTSDTEYEVVVTAIDEDGIGHEKKDSFRTASRDILLKIVLLLIIGTGLSITIASTMTRRVRKMMDIKVDIPMGLMGIDEMPKTVTVTPNDEKATEEGIPLVTVTNADKVDMINEEVENELLVVENPNQITNNYVDEMKPQPPERNQTMNSSKQLAMKSSGYVMPTQMKTKMMPSEKATEQVPLDALSIASSGYVDVNMLINRQ